jgi:hypothetical protein
LGRLEEIAAAVLWLCSPGASFVIGHALGRVHRPLNAGKRVRAMEINGISRDVEAAPGCLQL